MESSVQSSGILKSECAVLPLGNKSDAMPDEATQRTIFPCDRYRLHRVLYRKVLPVPAGPCKKKVFGICSSSMVFVIISKAARCPEENNRYES